MVQGVHTFPGIESTGFYKEGPSLRRSPFHCYSARGSLFKLVDELANDESPTTSFSVSLQPDLAKRRGFYYTSLEDNSSVFDC